MEQNVKEIIATYSKLGKIGEPSILNKIPLNERKYKCHTCHTIVDKTPCPICNESSIEIMCPVDHCHCQHEIISGITYCPLCGAAMCPDCGSHDVVQVSRVTGYLSEVSGWNRAKGQELKDRTRYSVT